MFVIEKGQAMYIKMEKNNRARFVAVSDVDEVNHLLSLGWKRAK